MSEKSDAAGERSDASGANPVPDWLEKDFEVSVIVEAYRMHSGPSRRATL